MKPELSESSIKISATAEPEIAKPGGERALLVAIALATTLAPLNSTMIAIALPQVSAAFEVDVASTSWLVIAYLVTMASLQPIAGKLGDRFGRRRLVLGGLLYFGIASLAAAVAPSFAVLVFFRVQQAVAGAIAFPNGAALIREVVPAARRASSFGLMGAMVSAAAALGPTIGGLVVGIADWRAIFYINLLVVPLALLLGWRAIPRIHRQSPDKSQPFDLGGALLLLVILVSIVGLLTQSRQSGDFSLLLPGAAVVVVIAVFFIRHELNHPDPVLQPRFFRRRPFAAATSTVALSNLAFYTTLLALPILLSERAGWTSAEIGLMLTTLSAGNVVFAPVGGRLADRFGRRRPAVIGLMLGACGMAILALVSGNLVVPLLLFGLALSGIGSGMASPGVQTTALESVDANQSGVAAGLFSTSRYMGSIIGSSLLAVLLITGPDGVQGFGSVFTLIVIAALLSIVTSLGLHDYPEKLDLKAA